MNTSTFDEKRYIILFVRLAIGIAFLSAVFDRVGLWGNPGDINVAWGSFKLFEDYVAYLNPFLSIALVTIVAYFVTVLEVVLGIMLILGFRLKLVALLSATLLLIFALSMTVIMGIKAPLDYSVFSVSAASFLLYLFIKEKEKADELWNAKEKALNV
ncbi:MAG: DoxX family membrane protein [Campylobacteraceae bacterium]|nr:DoxX family membrane protein [Campylobacteraceae bacterium]